MRVSEIGIANTSYLYKLRLIDMRTDIRLTQLAFVSEKFKIKIKDMKNNPNDSSWF